MNLPGLDPGCFGFTLERLFGWSKASKCKVLVKAARSRMKILRKKRDIQVRQLRSDAAELLRNGQDRSAFARVELLFKEQSLLAGYDMVEHFCECILKRLSYIRRHKDCPHDINEAVSSLIFAAARCADLPELQHLRRLFAKRYGHQFVSAAVEPFDGCGVNQQIIEKFSARSPPSDAKLKLIKEIVEEFNLQWGSPNVQAELCGPSKDSLMGSEGLQDYKLCQKEIDSFPFPTSHTLCIDSTSLPSANYGRGNIIGKFSNAVKKQEVESLNQELDTLPRHIGCKEDMFERDIPVISSSVKEIRATPAKIGRRLYVEKQNSLPTAIDLQCGHGDFGLRSNEHKFMNICDSSAFANDKLEDRVYHVENTVFSGVTVKCVEQAAGAAGVGANIKQSSKVLGEKKAFDCLNNSTENEEYASELKVAHQSEIKSAKSKYSRWMPSPKDGYCNMQISNGIVNPYLPEFSDELPESHSGFKSSARLKSMRVNKNLSMQIGTDLNVESYELRDFSMGEETKNWQADYNVTRRGSPTTAKYLGKLGINDREDGRHRWRSTTPRHAHYNSNDFSNVDEFRSLDRHVERWNAGHKECDFEDSVEVDVFGRFDEHVEGLDVSAVQEHASELQNISRSRKVRSDSSQRISLSSYDVEMNNCSHAEHDECIDPIFHEANDTEHFTTVQSRKKDKARKLCQEHFGESQVVSPFRRCSVFNADNKEPPLQYIENGFRLSSYNGGQMSYDMFDHCIGPDSGDCTINGKDIYSANGWSSPINARLHHRKSGGKGNKGNRQTLFEDVRHDTRKIYKRHNGNSGKQRPHKVANDVHQTHHEEALLETYNVNEQMFSPKDRTDGDSCSVSGLHNEVPQCREEGTNLVPQSFSVNHGIRSFKGNLHGPDHPSSNKNLYHIDNYDSDQEGQQSQQTDNADPISRTEFVRNSEPKERLYKGQKCHGNKPQKGRTKAQDVAHKHLYHVDMDRLDLEDMYSQKPESTEKFKKASPATHARSIRGDHDDRKSCKNGPNNGVSTSLACNEEPKCRGDRCDDWSAERMGKVYSPRVSVVCPDEREKTQRQHSTMNYRKEWEENQFFSRRHGIPEAECLHAERKSHGNVAKLKHGNASFDLVKDGKMQHSPDGMRNFQDGKLLDFQDGKLFMKKSGHRTPDHVTSLPQSVCGRAMSGNEHSKSTISRSLKFVQKDDNASCSSSSFISSLASASGSPPVSSPTHSSVPLESPLLAKPLSSAARQPLQRHPPLLPCTWQRAMSLPTEHSRASPARSSVRSNSLQPNLFKESSSNVDSPCIRHVHPKLPDYDDLAAQFAALKRQHKTNNVSE